MKGKFLLTLILGIVLSVTSASDSLAQTLVGVSGKKITINGQKKMLVAYGDYGMLSEGLFCYAAYDPSVPYRCVNPDTSFFDTLMAYRINFVRVWVNYHWTKHLTPFSGGSGNFQVKTWNQQFFDRLNDFVSQANRRGIVVQLCLFDENQLESDSLGLRWNYSPYKNSNNTDADFLNDNEKSQFFRWADTLASGGTLTSQIDSLRRVQLTLVDKVVQTVGNYPNVIYEVINEPEYDTTFRNKTLSWHKQIVSRLNRAFSLYSTTGSKLISVNLHESDGLVSWAKTESSVGIVSFHVNKDYSPRDGWSSLPGTIKSINKPLIVSNDGNFTQSNLGKNGGNLNTWAENYRSRDRSYWTERFASTMCNAYLDSTTNLAAFEFLDKDLMKKISGEVQNTNDTYWLTIDYNPISSKADLNILLSLMSIRNRCSN